MDVLETRWEKPPFDIVRAAHAELVVTDLERARDFYVRLLGFVVTEEIADALYLRGYEDRVHHSLVLRAGSAPLVGHLAFRVAEAIDLERLLVHFEADGSRPRLESGGVGHGQVLRVQDHFGFPLEFFHEFGSAERLLQRFDLYHGAHVLRLDHFNLHVAEVADCYEEYRRLGFRCSEYTVTEPGGGLWAAWLYRKPSVHDIALTNGFGPRLHHLGFAVPDPGSILRACDILGAAGHASAIERGPGRHGVSNAFFLYLRDPDGHRIELYSGDYFTGDPDLEPIRWNSDDPRRGTFWGHPAPSSWFTESTPVALHDGGVAEIRPPLLEELVGPVR